MEWLRPLEDRADSSEGGGSGRAVGTSDRVRTHKCPRALCSNIAYAASSATDHISIRASALTEPVIGLRFSVTAWRPDQALDHVDVEPVRRCH
jgi:hypothetical protein